MEATVKTIQHSGTEEQPLYSVEEVFDRLDKQFIDFYGEYGRKIVNTRRSEWKQDDEIIIQRIMAASLIL